MNGGKGKDILVATWFRVKGFGFENQGPILVPLKARCCNIIYNPKGPIILRITHLPRPRGGCLGFGV